MRSRIGRGFRVALRDRYERMSDAELLGVAMHRPGDFTREAVALATAILTERGVDVAGTRGTLDAAAAHERELASASEVQAAEEARRVLAAGRIGVCLACRARPPVVEHRVSAVQHRGQTQVSDLEIERLVTRELAIPLCTACDARLRPAWVPTGILALVWLVGANAAGIGLLALLTVETALDPQWALIAGLGLAALTLALPWWIRRHGAARIGLLHPLAAQLAADGFVFLPADEAGRPMLEVWADLLTSLDAPKRKTAEAHLKQMNDPATVARMRALAVHPLAGEHAIRVLVALRAREAIPDLERLAREAPGAVRDVAQGALVAFGEADP